MGTCVVANTNVGWNKDDIVSIPKLPQSALDLRKNVFIKAFITPTLGETHYSITAHFAWTRALLIVDGVGSGPLSLLGIWLAPATDYVE